MSNVLLIGALALGTLCLLNVEAGVLKRSASSEEEGGHHGPHNFTLPSNCTEDDKAKWNQAHENGPRPPPSGQAPPAPGQAPPNAFNLSDVCHQAIAAELAEHFNGGGHPEKGPKGHGPPGHGPNGQGPPGQGPPGQGRQGGQGFPGQGAPQGQSNQVAKRSPADQPPQGGALPQLPQACQNAADQAKLQAFHDSHPGHGPPVAGQAPPQGQAPLQGQAPSNLLDVSAECRAALIVNRPLGPPQPPQACQNAADQAKFQAFHDLYSGHGQAPPQGQAPPSLADFSVECAAALKAGFPGHGHQGGQGAPQGQSNQVAKRSPADQPPQGGAPPQLPQACQNDGDKAKLKEFRDSHPGGPPQGGQAPPQGQAPPNPAGVSPECRAALEANRPNHQN